MSILRHALVYVLGSILMLCCVLPSAAFAAGNTGKLANVIVRSLGYVRGLKSKSSDVIRVTILYNPGLAGSVDRANALATDMTNVPKGKIGKLQVNVAAIGSAGIGDAKVYLVPAGVGDAPAGLATALKGNRALSIGYEGADCTRAGVCAIGIETAGGTKIYLNERALENAGYDVDSNFRYLAKRL